MMAHAPAVRVRVANDRPFRASGRWVLYWMTASRRTTYNFGLQHAIVQAHEARKPLVVLEALRSDHEWASDRLHRFVIDGMADNARRFAKSAALYHPYVEPSRGAGKGLLRALAGDACLVVADEFPCFFIPRMIEAAARTLPVRFEVVDSNGLVPLAAAERTYPTAHAFRRFVQRGLESHLESFPEADPLAGMRLPRLKALDGSVRERWPAAPPPLLAGDRDALASLPIDHSVPAVSLKGGSRAARQSLDRFLADRLAAYPEASRQPEAHGTSQLSPYLHFGHISSHEVFAELMTRERWTTRRLSGRRDGRRSGWWGASEGAEAFLDQLVVWRELGFNMSAREADYDRYESLPAWARATLRKHARDRRPVLYDLETLEAGRTDDELWNAAQGQLLRDGWYHNYMRMVWGKKILEWSKDPREALERMLYLMNKYSLDGRDPNTYSGIFWVLGRYDRAWGPERPIFGTVRYMSSENTARTLRVKDYIRTYAPGPAGADPF